MGDPWALAAGVRLSAGTSRQPRGLDPLAQIARAGLADKKVRRGGRQCSDDVELMRHGLRHERGLGFNDAIGTVTPAIDARCLLCPDEQTSPKTAAMSALCQRTKPLAR